MKIRIRYELCTDGDYSLRNPESFSCIGREVEMQDNYFDYIGVMNFQNKDVCECKCNAKIFLEELLCDGIHISYTHYWLIKSFYNIIESLINFINENDAGELCKRLSGNYDGTMIMVEFI